MAFKRYYYNNGRMVAQQLSAGASQANFLLDSLGSVTGTTNHLAQLQNQYWYKPFGAQLAKTGTGTDPDFQWVGSAGYRQIGRVHSDVYMRHRHVGTVEGRFTTRDPLWPVAPPFTYANARPTTLADPSGLQAGAAVLGGLCGGGQAGAEGGSFVGPEGTAAGLAAGAVIGAALGLLSWAGKSKPWDLPDARTRRWTLAECNELHSAYKDVCIGDERLIRFYRCRTTDDCATLGNKFRSFNDCQFMRDLYKRKCLPLTGKPRDPEHQWQIDISRALRVGCAVLYVAKGCSQPVVPIVQYGTKRVGGKTFYE